jgi:hypothetical protein
MSFSSLPLPGHPRPAPAGAGHWSSLGSLQPAGGLLGLLEILLAGAPENHAPGHAPDGDRGSESLGTNRSRSCRWSGICAVAIQDGHRLQQSRACVHGDEHRTRSEAGFEVACL